MSNDCYSVLYRGGSVTNITQPVDARLLPCAQALQLTDLTPASSNAPAFYRVRQVPVAQPLDSDFDGDGISNLEEYRNDTDPEIP